MWHDDEETRIWHDGDVIPWEWHWTTKAKRGNMPVLVMEEGVNRHPFVVTVWLDDADTEHFESPHTPTFGYEWPRSWRWASVYRLIQESGGCHD